MKRLLRPILACLALLALLPIGNASFINTAGSRYVAPSGGGGEVLFADAFTSGFASTQNGISWNGTLEGPGDGTVSVSGGTLNFAHANTAEGGHLELTGQLPLNFGREIWFKFDFLVPTTYSRIYTVGASNNKFLYVWTGVNNNFDTDYNDTTNNEVAGFEYRQGDPSATPVAWPPGGSDGDTSLTTVDTSKTGYQHYDDGTIFTVAQRGTWVTYCLRARLGTSAGSGSAGNGVIQVWKDGTLIQNTTNAVLFRNSGNSLRWFYLWGYQNTDFTNANTWRVDNFSIGKTNICGVTVP